MNISIQIKFLVSVMIVLTYSCGVGKIAPNNKRNDKMEIRYLSSVINDTTYFEIPELKIVDSKVYQIFDSVILWTERCSYFDNRVKNLYAYLIHANHDGDSIVYTINAHLSPAQALGLNLIQAGILKEIQNIGIFYYKNFLFVVHIGKDNDPIKVDDFPFVNKKTNKLKIRAPEFFNEKVYESFINFKELHGEYIISKNKLCGPQILIE